MSPLFSLSIELPVLTAPLARVAAEPEAAERAAEQKQQHVDARLRAQRLRVQTGVRPVEAPADPGPGGAATAGSRGRPGAHEEIPAVTAHRHGEGGENTFFSFPCAGVNETCECALLLCAGVSCCASLGGFVSHGTTVPAVLVLKRLSPVNPVVPAVLVLKRLSPVNPKNIFLSDGFLCSTMSQCSGSGHDADLGLGEAGRLGLADRQWEGTERTGRGRQTRRPQT